MTTITHQPYEASSPVRSATLPAAIAWLQSKMAGFLHVYDRRHQRHALLDLDARLLEDIGRSRGQALAEGSRHFWR